MEDPQRTCLEELLTRECFLDFLVAILHSLLPQDFLRWLLMRLLLMHLVVWELVPLLLGEEGACGLDEELADAGGIPGGGIPPVSIPWKGDCLAVPVKAPDPWRGILVMAKSCAPSIASVLGSFAFLS